MKLSIIDAAYALSRTGDVATFKQLKNRMVDDGWSEGLDRLTPIWNDLQRQCRLSKQAKDDAASAAIGRGRPGVRHLRARYVERMEEANPATV